MKTIFSVETLKDNRIKLVVDNQTFHFTLENLPKKKEEAKSYATLIGECLSQAMKKLYMMSPP